MASTLTHANTSHTSLEPRKVVSFHDGKSQGTSSGTPHFMEVSCVSVTSFSKVKWSVTSHHLEASVAYLQLICTFKVTFPLPVALSSQCQRMFAVVVLFCDFYRNDTSLSTIETREHSPEVSIPPIISGQTICFQCKKASSGLAILLKLGIKIRKDTRKKCFTTHTLSFTGGYMPQTRILTL